MKLKNYFFIMLVGMLWSTGAMAGTVNINSADVAELVDGIHGIGQACPGDRELSETIRRLRFNRRPHGR